MFWEPHTNAVCTTLLGSCTAIKTSCAIVEVFNMIKSGKGGSVPLSGSPIEILEGLNEILGHFHLDWWCRAINIAINAMKPATAVRNIAMEGYFSGGQQELEDDKRASMWSDTTILLSSLAWTARTVGLADLSNAIEWAITSVKAAEVGDTAKRQLWR